MRKQHRSCTTDISTLPATDLAELIRLIRLMRWDRQRFSTSGIETFDKIEAILAAAQQKKA